MTKHHATAAVLLALAGALLLALGVAPEWSAPLFAVALVEAGAAAFTRKARH